MIIEDLVNQGFIVNLNATPYGCCASILSEKKPYLIYRCQNADSMNTALASCLSQMKGDSLHGA